jgi:hypothetical protein
VEDGHLKLVTTCQLAVNIMTSSLAESFLVTPSLAGPTTNPWMVHKITIVLFTQDMQWDTSVWGQLLGFHVISLNSCEGGITFTTCGEDLSGGNTSEDPYL